MRIGYYGFTTDADLIITPPTSVTYRPPLATRQVTTSARSVSLRRLRQRNGTNLTLTWDSLPENELAALTLIPSNETHTLVTETGKELLVVIGEPQRTLLNLKTRDGYDTFAVTLPVFEVNRETLSEVAPPAIPTQRILVLTKDLTVPVSQWPPVTQTPQYTQISPRRASGLPPGLDDGSARRFNFKVADFADRLRYFSTDASCWFDAPATVQPLFNDWHSHRSGSVVAASELRRFNFSPQPDFAVGVQFYWDGTTTAGNVFESVLNGYFLNIRVFGNTATIFYTLANNDPVGFGSYTLAQPVVTGYNFVGAAFTADRGDGLPRFRACVNSLAADIVSTAGTWATGANRTTLGGSGVLVDDLILANKYFAPDTMRNWLLEV